MSVHAYPTSVALTDYLRSGTGLFIGAAPLVAVDTTPTVTTLLIFILLVFSAYALGTVHRHFTRVETNERGIKVRGLLSQSLGWEEIQDLKLSYFSTRQDKSGGWLQLRLSGNGRSLQVDSRIDGFDLLAARAAAAATCNGASIDFATRQNFHALGIPASADPLEAGP